MIGQSTGFKRVTVDGATADYLVREAGEYKLLLRIKHGDVWGRYGARVIAGELGRELGGIWSVLTGSYQSGVGSVTGSTVDRILSQIVGQPISISMVMLHHRANAPRLDVVNQFSVIQPTDPVPSVQYIGLRAGTLYSNDPAYARRVLGDPLIRKLENFRSAYVRVDESSIGFYFAGTENDYSGMLRDTGGYFTLLNDVTDVLLGLAGHL